MQKSDWIALTACIIAFIGLIPSFYGAFYQKGKKTKAVNPSLDTSNTLTEKSDVISIDEKDKKRAKNDDQPMPIMLKVLLLVIMAVIIGLVELILFSAVAHWQGVTINFETMTLVWKIVFWAMFLIPGILLLLALTVFTTLFND